MRFKLRPAASLVLAAAAVASGVLVTGTPAAAGATTVPLAAKPAGDIVVDDARQRLYVSFPDLNQILVRDLNGAAVATVTGLTRPYEMAVAPDGGYVYVVEQSRASIARVSTADHTVSRITLTNACPLSVTATGGKVWFSFATCNGPSGGVGVVDSAAGTATTTVTEQWNQAPMARALPDHPERLVLTTEHGGVFVYDVSSGAPVQVTRGSVDLDGGGNCRDSAVLAGGTRIAFACGSPSALNVYDTADLSLKAAFPAFNGLNAVASTADGRYVAIGNPGPHGQDVEVYDTQTGMPGTWLRYYEFGEQSYLNTGTLVWGADGRLYGASGYHYDASSLQILTQAKTPQPVLRLGPASAVQAASRNGHVRVTMTGTVACDKSTVVDVQASLIQMVDNYPRSMTAMVSVACTAGVTRAWSAEIPPEFRDYFSPGEVTVSVIAKALDAEYSNYVTTGSTSFTMHRRLSSPFGRRG